MRNRKEIPYAKISIYLMGFSVFAMLKKKTKKHSRLFELKKHFMAESMLLNYSESFCVSVVLKFILKISLSFKSNATLSRFMGISWHFIWFSRKFLVCKNSILINAKKSADFDGQIDDKQTFNFSYHSVF